jgi:hypothetical protein
MPPKISNDPPVEDIVEEGPGEVPATDSLGRPLPVEFPVGQHVGVGAETCWVGEFEYVVDPETGCITGRV